MLHTLLIDTATLGFQCYSTDYSIGISILYNSLKDANIPCKVLKRPTQTCATYQSWIETILNQILEHSPQVIALSARCDTFPIAIDLIKCFKSVQKDIITILGGPHVSICAEQTLSLCPELDFIIIGEGEHSLPLLIKRLGETPLRLEDIKGLAYNDNNGNFFSTYDSKYPPLTNCSIQQYEFILDNYTNKKSWFPIEVGRGCQYNCTFCCTTKMWKRNFRLYDAQSVVTTIKTIQNNYNINNFLFIHDNILSSPLSRSFLQILAKQLKGNSIFWECSARIDNITADNASLLKAAHCYSIYFGIESGSPKIQKLYRKNIDLASIPNKIELLRTNGIFFFASFIVGHPEETIKDVAMTFALSIQLKNAENCLLIQLHKLSFINGSDIFSQYKDRLAYDGDYPDKKQVPLDLPLKVDIKNKEIFSYYFRYVSYNSDIKKILDQLDKYAHIINHYSKSLKLLMDMLGQDSVIEILNVFIDYLASENLSKIKEYCKGKLIDTDTQECINLIHFEETIKTNFTL